MKYLLLLLCALLLTEVSLAQSTSDFEWLAGTWERQNTKPGTTAVELWENGAGGMIGQGITMKGADTVFVENLKILKKGNNLFYVADVPHNPAPTFFKIISFKKHQFTCENPTHDFPKRIDYTFKGDFLTVMISGDGKAVPFIFKKM